MHLKKKQPPLVVSYRETSSSICSFIDSGGPLKPLGGMPLLGLRVRFTNQRVADSFSGAHDLPLVSVCSTAGSLVLQQQVTPLSFFLIGPQASKVYQLPHQHPKSGETQASLLCGHSESWDTRHPLFSSLPRMKPPGAPGPDRRATPVSAGSGAKPCQFHQHSESGERNQSLGLPSESWNFG